MEMSLETMPEDKLNASIDNLSVIIKPHSRKNSMNNKSMRSITNCSNRQDGHKPVSLERGEN